MSTRSATCVLRFPLQLVEVLGAAIAGKVRWLEVERQYALGREGPKQHLHPMLEVFDP